MILTDMSRVFFFLLRSSLYLTQITVEYLFNMPVEEYADENKSILLVSAVSCTQPPERHTCT